MPASAGKKDHTFLGENNKQEKALSRAPPFRSEFCRATGKLFGLLLE